MTRTEAGQTKGSEFYNSPNRQENDSRFHQYREFHQSCCLPSFHYTKLITRGLGHITGRLGPAISSLTLNYETLWDPSPFASPGPVCRLFHTVIPTTYTNFIMVLLVRWDHKFELLGQCRGDNKHRPRKWKKGVKKLTLESGEPSHLNFFHFLTFEWVFERIQTILALILRELSFKYMICFLFSPNAHSGLWAGLSPRGIVAEAHPFSWKLSKELKTLRGVGGGEETSPYFGGK